VLDSKRSAATQFALDLATFLLLRTFFLAAFIFLPGLLMWSGAGAATAGGAAGTATGAVCADACIQIPLASKAMSKVFFMCFL
jgi:hypothetical protein